MHSGPRCRPAGIAAAFHFPPNGRRCSVVAQEAFKPGRREAAASPRARQAGLAGHHRAPSPDGLIYLSDPSGRPPPTHRGRPVECVSVAVPLCRRARRTRRTRTPSTRRARHAGRMCETRGASGAERDIECSVVSSVPPPSLPAPLPLPQPAPTERKTRWRRCTLRLGRRLLANNGAGAAAAAGRCCNTSFESVCPVPERAALLLSCLEMGTK